VSGNHLECGRCGWPFAHLRALLDHRQDELSPCFVRLELRFMEWIEPVAGAMLFEGYRARNRRYRARRRARERGVA
jgi:hypothetical protein